MQPAEPEEEYVLLTERVAPDSERLRLDPRRVTLSEEDKAAAVVLDDEQLTASSGKGYRMVRWRYCGAGCGGQSGGRCGRCGPRTLFWVCHAVPGSCLGPCVML